MHALAEVVGWSEAQLATRVAGVAQPVALFQDIKFIVVERGGLERHLGI